MLLQITEPTDNPQNITVQAIGVDLGTTNCVMAYSQNAVPFVLKDNETGSDIIPSFIFYADDGQIFIGNQGLQHQGQGVPIWSIKRLMDQSIDTWHKNAHLFPHLNRDESSHDILRFQINGHSLTIIEIVSQLLRYIKNAAEKSLNQPIDKAVITVPAYFDEVSRQATKDAAMLAGLDVLRLINEPTAAAFAYGLDQKSEGIYAVYDLGGGTFDFSLLDMAHGVFQVLATGGNVLLGGDDIDRLILNHVYDTPPSGQAFEKASRIAKHVKEYLSFKEAGSWEFPDISEPVIMNQFFLERLMAPLIGQTLDICKKVILDARLNLKDIKGVILVGGMTKIPYVRECVRAFFGQPPLCNLDPDRIVAMGAALQAEALTQGMDPLLLDVTPLSLGIETMGHIVEKIIHRNTPIPVSAHQDFTTFKDNQTALKIHIVQGESDRLELCRSLGTFTFSGIDPKPAGQAKIRILFRLDADGLLNVSATDESSGKSQSIGVQSSYGLTRDQIKHMILES